MAAVIGAGALLTVLQISLGAGTAWAHAAGEPVADLSTYARIARTVALAAAVLVAGAALVRPLTGRATDSGTRLLRAAAASGTVGVGVAIGAGAPPGELVALGVLLPVAAVAVEGGVRSWPAVAAGLATVVVLSAGAVREGPRDALLIGGHIMVASVWLGTIVASATAAPGSRLGLLRRLWPVAVGSAAAVSLTGVLSARAEGVTLDGIAASSFGTVVLLKAGLLALAAGAGLVVRRRLAVRRRGSGRRAPSTRATALARGELALTLAAALAGAALTSLPSPGPRALEGVPLARALKFGEETTGLLVVPHRPGRNVVHLMTDLPSEVVVGGRTYRAERRPGAEGLWADVILPSGHPRLDVRQGGRVVQQVLDPGPAPGAAIASPDAAECASAALGGLLGGSSAPLSECPSARLGTADAAALDQLLVELHRRGARSLRLITDDSGRSRSAAKLMTRAGLRLGIDVTTSERTDVILAVSGWSAAAASFAAAGGAGAPYGTWLAPWLVQSSLVAATGTAPLATLPFDPHSAPVGAYVSALRRIGPGQSASAAGLAAYAAARGEQLPQRVALYAATAGFHVMPMNGEGGGHPAGPGWFARGSLTPVSGVLGASARGAQDALAGLGRR